MIHNNFSESNHPEPLPEQSGGEIEFQNGGQHYRIIFWLAAGGLLALSLLSMFLHELHRDMGWHLYLAGRILEGARLYQDIFDNNPPTITYLTIPPVWLARILGCSEILTFYLYILLLGLLALALCWYILNQKLSISAPGRYILLLTLFFCLFVQITTFVRYQFGQREHVMLILVMPYLFAAAARAAGQSLNGKLAFVIGVLAGIGIAIKPYFLLLWLMIEAYLFLTQRIAGSWRRAENIGIALIQGVYTVFILVDGGYLRYIPILWQLYQTFDANFANLLMWEFYELPLTLAGPATKLCLIAVVAGLIIRPATRQEKELKNIFLTAVIGLFLIGCMQQKGWDYHFYPAGAMALLALVVVLVRVITFQKVIYPQGFILALSLILLLQSARPVVDKAGSVIAALNAGQPLSHRLSFEPILTEMTRLVETRTRRGEYILVLSGDIYPHFPLINYTGAGWPLRYFGLWQIISLYREPNRNYFSPKSAGRFPYRTPSEMDTLERDFFDNVISDILAHPPKLVFADATLNFDFIEYFSQDARFAEFWSHYASVAQLTYYDKPFPTNHLLQVFEYLPPDVYAASFSQKLHIINPGDKPYVFVFLWHNGQAESYLLDDASYRGREYDIEWIINPTQIWFKGDYQLQDSNMTARLSPDHYLAVGVAFSDRHDRVTQQIFERRFRFNLTTDNRIEAFAPPEEWRNLRWPDESGWQMEDIAEVMIDR